MKKFASLLTDYRLTDLCQPESISVAENLKANNPTLVGTMKSNKRCIPTDFLTKADPGTVQYAFAYATDFTLFSIAPKTNKRV